MAVASSFPSQAVTGPRLIKDLFTFDLNTKERIDPELPSKIHALEPLSPGAPVLALTNRLGGPIVKRQPIFYMFQMANLRNFVQCADATFAAGDATIDFNAADVDLFKKGYHIMNCHTREIMRVNDTPAPAMPLTRSVGTVAAAGQVTTTDEFVILGYASAEGDVRHTGNLRQPTMIFNYNGEWQDSYEISQLEEGSAKTSGSARGDARMDKLEQGRQTIELKALFDQRAKFVNEDNRMVYVPNGLDAICTENEADFGGTISHDKIMSAAEDVARYGPSTRWVMASPRMMRKINGLYEGDRRWPGDKTQKFAGVNVIELQCGNLKLNIFPHLLLQDSTETDANALSGTAYVCNFERGGNAPGFAMTTMRGELNGFFKWFLNLQTDGNRKVIDQLVVNYGFSYTFAEHFQRWINPGA